MLRALIQRSRLLLSLLVVAASPPLSVESCLHCVLTSFTTLRGHGASLTIDVKEVGCNLNANPNVVEGFVVVLVGIY